MDPQSKNITFFRSVLGDIPSDRMGITYSHEHVVIDTSYATTEYPEFTLNDENKICAELMELKSLGCATMVDTMPANAGRNVEKLAAISRKTEINLIAPTGIHLEIYYPTSHWRYQYNEEQLTQLFIDDIKHGIDRFDYNGPLIERTAHHAGLIKLATGDNAISRHQEMIFRAAVNAHRITGAPILTHTNHGRHALDQVELFKKLGADLNHVVISHVDRYKDVAYHRELLQSGVSVEYDSAFRWQDNMENFTYVLLEKILPEFPNQVTVGMDAAKSSYWKSYGGKPGLAYLLTTFHDEMRTRGLSDYLKKIFVDNPARIFSFRET
jgi:5-phospho-D-xylono-1,4-lactonase